MIIIKNYQIIFNKNLDHMNIEHIKYHQPDYRYYDIKHLYR